MVNLTTGIYGPPMGQVERAARNAPLAPRAEKGTPSAPGDLLSRDSINLAAISDLANRSVSFRMAIKNLDFIDGYLGDILRTGC